MEPLPESSVITARIKADILGDQLRKVSQINVITANGAVSLNGFLDSRRCIDRAMEIVQSVKDVKPVEISLVVKGS